MCKRCVVYIDNIVVRGPTREHRAYMDDRGKEKERLDTDAVSRERKDATLREETSDKV